MFLHQPGFHRAILRKGPYPLGLCVSLVRDQLIVLPNTVQAREDVVKLQHQDALKTILGTRRKWHKAQHLQSLKIAITLAMVQHVREQDKYSGPYFGQARSHTHPQNAHKSLVILHCLNNACDMHDLAASRFALILVPHHGRPRSLVTISALESGKSCAYQ